MKALPSFKAWPCWKLSFDIGCALKWDDVIQRIVCSLAFPANPPNRKNSAGNVKCSFTTKFLVIKFETFLTRHHADNWNVKVERPKKILLRPLVHHQTPEFFFSLCAKSLPLGYITVSALCNIQQRYTCMSHPNATYFYSPLLKSKDKPQNVWKLTWLRFPTECAHEF